MQKVLAYKSFFYVLANLIFVISHYIQLFIQILRKFCRHCSQKEKFIKSLLAFGILML